MATINADPAGRHASLKLAHGPEGQVLTARVPSDITEHDFVALGKSTLDLVRRLTGCNCMSGRIKVVIEDDFADVIRVNLNPAVGGPG